MSGTSDYLQNKWIDYELRGQTFTPPANTFLALLKCTKGLLARSTTYAVNDTVAVAISGFNKLYKCTAITTGTTAGSAPSYTGATGEVVVDGGATFTEQSAATLEANTGINEVSGGSYARMSIASSLAAWAGTQGAGTTVASSGTSATTSNNGVITYAQATADWTTGTEKIWGWATFDALSAGNMLRFGGFASAHSVLNTNTFSIAAGQLSIKVDN